MLPTHKLAVEEERGQKFSLAISIKINSSSVLPEISGIACQQTIAVVTIRLYFPRFSCHFYCFSSINDYFEVSVKNLCNQSSKKLNEAVLMKKVVFTL